MDQSQILELLKHEQKLPFFETTYMGKKLRFAATNQKCFYFAESIANRESDTNEWIAKLTPEDIFFDIGANNSVFSIVASAIYGARSFAFEPHFASYHISQQNVYANNLESLMQLFPLAISEKTGLDILFLSSITAGKSLNNFGEARPSTDLLWNATKPQPAVSMSIDDICKHLDVIPTFIKVDVDGIEAKIITGAAETLKNPILKEIMIEFDKTRPVDVKAAKKIMDSGFILSFVGPSGYFFRRQSC